MQPRVQNIPSTNIYNFTQDLSRGFTDRGSPQWAINGSQSRICWDPGQWATIDPKSHVRWDPGYAHHL